MEIYGVCFEPGHISVLTEYMPNSGLRQLLSNESISLSWPIQLKIALQVLNFDDYFQITPPLMML